MEHIKGNDMKAALICLGLFATLTSFAQPIISNNDINNSKSLQYDIDGVEMWTIPQAEQTTALENFKFKCSETIPAKFAERISFLSADAQDFEYTTKITTKVYRGLGTQHICRVKVNILSTHKYYFGFDYSKIISVNPYDTCKAMVAELDTQVLEKNLFDRRAYFELGITNNNETYYKKCQVLAIILKGVPK